MEVLLIVSTVFRLSYILLLRCIELLTLDNKSACFQNVSQFQSEVSLFSQMKLKSFFWQKNENQNYFTEFQNNLIKTEHEIRAC